MKLIHQRFALIRQRLTGLKAACVVNQFSLERANLPKRRWFPIESRAGTRLCNDSHHFQIGISALRRLFQLLEWEPLLRRPMMLINVYVYVNVFDERRAGWTFGSSIWPISRRLGFNNSIYHSWNQFHGRRTRTSTTAIYFNTESNFFISA